MKSGQRRYEKKKIEKHDSKDEDDSGTRAKHETAQIYNDTESSKRFSTRRHSKAQSKTISM